MKKALLPITCLTILLLGLTVPALADAPAPAADPDTTPEDVAVVIDVLANDTQPTDGDAIDPASVAVPGSAGTLSPANGAVAINVSTGEITYTPFTDFNGGDSFDYTVCDDGSVNGGPVECASATVTVTVDPVNDVPSFTKGGDESVLEDAGAQSVPGWATAISAGPADESTQALTFNVTNDNNALFSVQPVITASGELSYTPAVDTNGSAVVTVSLSDDGGTANGGSDTSADQTFNITVTAVNDVPSFTKGGDESVLEDAGAQSVPGWATAISAGPADESTQALTFSVTNDNNALFSVQPVITASGELSYTPAVDTNGSAVVTVSLSDDGGTANGGSDTSADQTFNITVTAVNDVPSFTKGGDESVLEDAGAQSVPGWATAISAGPADESTQALTFSVTNDNNALFSVQPVITASGELSYTPAADTNGSAVVTVSLSDDGGTANGGSDTSADQTFNITVTAVNDVPSFTKGGDESVLEDAGAQSVPGWATAISAGPADESTQALTFSVTNDNNALFSVQPVITASGELSYTPAVDTNGSAVVTVSLSDDGGTANGGSDTSADQTFNITVTAVNDVPSFTKGGDESVLEDAGAQSVPGWATAISAGPADESTQALTFSVTNDNNALFSVQPVITASGELSYTPAVDTNGSAVVTVSLSDDGGTANGGSDTSADQTFNITVTAVNDVPSFTKGGDESVLEDAGAQSVPGWATAISAGPADESAQALTFNITGNTNPALFSVAPAVGGSAGNLGELTYTPAANAFGSADITIEVMDDGGTLNGGIDTSPSQTFTITVDNVNDLPSFISGGNVITETGTGEQTLPWATAVSTGPANENQTASFTVTGDCNPALLVAGPSIDPDGTLRFTPIDFAVGTCNVSATLSDGEDNSGPVAFILELVTASEPVADPQTVETDGGNPLPITLTGSDPDDQLPLVFQVIEPVTDADTGVIISDSGPFRGTLDTTTPVNATDTSAVVTYTPSQPTISQSAIIATDSFVLEKFADILAGDVVVNGAGGTATMERSTTTPAGFAIKADSLDVHNTATVGGDALCNAGDYAATCDPLTLPVYDLLPPFLVGSVDDANDVSVPRKGTANLTPGLYGDITVDREGDLVFAPGKYSMRSLTAENKANLLFSGATEIKIAERLELASYVDVNAGGAARDVIFYVAGGDGANPAAVVGFNNAVFNANVYAPNGTLSIGQDSAVSGAFLGQHVVVGSKATVQLANGFGEAPDQFAFEVTDAIGLRSEQAVVEINPDDSCRDDAGQIVAIAAYAGTASTDGAASIDITLRGCESTDVPVTVTATNGTQGTVSGVPAGPVGPPYEFVVTYTPSDPVPNNRDSFEFSFDNGSSQATATVDINQPPCDFVEAVTTDSFFATDEGNPLTITLSGCDPDDGVLAFSTDDSGLSACSSCALGALAGPIADNRPGHTSFNVVFTHSEVAGLTTSFDYTVTGSSGAASKTLTVEVNPVPVAPVANDDAFSVTFGGVLNGNVLTNDTDANSDPLTATLVGGAPAKASLFTLNPDGSFVYTHNGTVGGTDSFQYQASDGALSSPTATANITIVAATISISVSKAGPAGSEDSLITSNPAGISCLAGCTSDSAIFTTTEAIRLNVQAATGFVFTGWTGDAECAGGQLLPIADRSCIANFAVDTSTPPTGDPVLVTIQKAGNGSGTVISSPAGIDCGGVCSATISGNPRITLSAAADPGSVFNGFTGGPDGNDCNDSELEAEFPTTCTATFTLAGRTLTILFFGNSGTVASSPGGISCGGEPCSASFANGTTVTLSARPDAGPPSGISWGGDCQQDGTFNNKATVLMTADSTCTVSFN